MSAFTVLLDACVLYPAPVRDLLIRLALSGLFRAKWTDEIHDEWIRNLLANRNDLTADQLARTRALMDKAVPDSLVTDYQDLIPALTLPDQNDRHVLAAAIRAKAETIVTSNTADFPVEILQKYDVESQHPDDFIVLQMGLSAAAVCSAAKSARTSLKNPPLSVEEYLDGLKACGLTQTATELRKFSDLL